MSYIKIAVLLLQLVNKILDWSREKSLLDQGAQMQIAKEMQEMAKRLEVVRAVELEIGNLDDAAVRERLRDDFRD